MPTYEYKCKECNHQFELWQEVGADAPQCPECGAEVQKVFHPVRTIFKGSGFYITDSRPAVTKTSGSETKGTETKDSNAKPAEKSTAENKPSESKEGSSDAKKDTLGKDS